MSRIYALIAFAFIVRLLYLAYNLSLHLPPIWFDSVLTGFTMAEHFSGKDLTLGYPLSAALAHYDYEARGMTFVHQFFISIFGNASFPRVIVFQMLLDAWMVGFLVSIGTFLKNRVFGLWCGIFYALCPVAIYMSAVPIWYTYLNAAVIVMSWCVLRILSAPERERKKYLGILLVAAVLGIQFRITTVLVPGFFAFILLLLKWRRKIKLDLKNIALIGLVSVLAYGSYISLNKYLSQGKSSGRSNFAHSFFMGVGERPNHYQAKHLLDGTDESVMAYYVREVQPSATDIENNSSQEYLGWVKAKAFQFIGSETKLYFSLYIKRITEMVFPKFRISFAADTDAITKIEKPEVREERMQIIRGSGKYSFVGQARLFQINKTYFFEFWIRIFVMIFLPIGFLLALVFGSKQERIYSAILIAPLICFCLVLSLIRLPNFDHAAAWSAAFPVSLLGWFKIRRKS